MTAENFHWGARPVASGIGFEFPAGGIGVDWALATAETLRKKAGGGHPLHLDIGGAGARNAELFARAGYRTVIIDIGDEKDNIGMVNARLLSEGVDFEPISLFQADVRDLTPFRLGAICKGVQPTVVTAFNFIHLLDKTEAERLVRVVAGILPFDGVLAMSYCTSGSGLGKREYETDHHPDDVIAMAVSAGLSIKHEEYMSLGPFRGSKMGKIGQGFLRLE